MYVLCNSVLQSRHCGSQYKSGRPPTGEPIWHQNLGVQNKGYWGRVTDLTPEYIERRGVDHPQRPTVLHIRRDTEHGVEQPCAAVATRSHATRRHRSSSACAPLLRAAWVVYGYGQRSELEGRTRGTHLGHTFPASARGANSGHAFGASIRDTHSGHALRASTRGAHFKSALRRRNNSSRLGFRRTCVQPAPLIMEKIDASQIRQQK